MDKFLADVKSVYDRLGRCVVAVSEGIQDADRHAYPGQADGAGS